MPHEGVALLTLLRTRPWTITIGAVGTTGYARHDVRAVSLVEAGLSVREADENLELF